MTINGLVLPPDFVSAIANGALCSSCGSWQLLHDLDAWGQPLETQLDAVFEDVERLKEETQRLARDFPNDPFDGPDPSENEPGFIPQITDFAKIVCFGVSGEGDPFCFDFRTDLQKPEVIWWEDTFWRRVAPEWASFAALFDLTPPAADK